MRNQRECVLFSFLFELSCFFYSFQLGSNKEVNAIISLERGKKNMNKDKIDLDGKEYFLASSAYTQFAYKELTGRSFLKDLKYIIVMRKKKSKNKKTDDIACLEKITDMILHITYIMIKEASEEQVTNYTDFIKSVGSIYDKSDWIEKVITLAAAPLSRQLQKVRK